MTIELRRPDSAGIRVKYDDAQFIHEMIDGRGKSLRFDCHPSGLLLKMTERSGAVKRYGYDEYGRITELTKPTGNIYRFGYDTDNQHRVVFFPDGKYEAYEYQKESLSRLYRRNGDHVNFTYNFDKKLTNIEYSDGLHLNFSYNDQNQLTHADNGAHSVTFEYNESGHRIAEEIDGRHVEFHYNDEGLLKTFVTHRGDGVSFDHGDDQRVNRITDWTGNKYNIQYNALGSVSTLTFPNQVRQHRNFTPFGLVESEEFQNRTDNIQRKYTYDANDLLVTVNDSKHSIKQHRFDADDQLMSIDSLHRHVKYTYDAFGRRIVKHFNGITTTYIWWGDQIVAEDRDGPNPVEIDYLYLPGTLQLVSMRINRQSYYYQTDHLGSPIRLTDENGRIVWSAEPHGFDFVIVTNDIHQPFRFPGQYYDEETGLFYNGTRYYHPATGRYVSPDPLFWEDQTNLYVYAKNNPAVFVDPNGWLVFLAVVGAVLVGAAIGAAFAGAKKIADNKVQGKPWHDGIGGSMLKGAAFGGVGGLAVGLGAPVLAVGVAGLAAAPINSALQAPEGQKFEACLDSLPVVGAIRRHADNEGDPNRDAQLGVDIAFDALGLGLLALGSRAGRGGGPPRSLNVKMPVLEMQPAMATVSCPPIPGGISIGTTTVTVPLTPAAQATTAAAPMAMAATSGGGGGDDGDKGDDDNSIPKKASDMEVIKPGTKAWDNAVKDIKSLVKSKNYRVQNQSQAEQLLKEARGNVPKEKTYTDTKYKKGYEVHPNESHTENAPQNDLPHIKWKDWEGGKSQGANGHIFFDK